jgi:hypothetical protein
MDRPPVSRAVPEVHHPALSGAVGSFKLPKVMAHPARSHSARSATYCHVVQSRHARPQSYPPGGMDRPPTFPVCPALVSNGMRTRSWPAKPTCSLIASSGAAPRRAHQRGWTFFNQIIGGASGGVSSGRAWRRGSLHIGKQHVNARKASVGVWQLSSSAAAGDGLIGSRLIDGA